MSAPALVTPADLVAEFGADEMIALTDVGTPRTGAVVDAVAQRACDRADAEIYAALGARYAIPLSSVPAVLSHIARDLAHYYLYQTDPPSWVGDRAKGARSTLRSIMTGDIKLGITAAGDPVTDQASAMPDIDAGQKLFGRGAL